MRQAVVQSLEMFPLGCDAQNGPSNQYVRHEDEVKCQKENGCSKSYQLLNAMSAHCLIRQQVMAVLHRGICSEQPEQSFLSWHW